MQTKLTLRMDDQLIAAAKEHALATGRSLSQLVAEYLAAVSLDEIPERDSSVLTPTVARLRGCLRGVDLDVNDYRAHLEDKYL